MDLTFSLGLNGTAHRQPFVEIKNHIVVSAENNAYLAWQCKLFHYSCVSRLGQCPVFLVHQRDPNWRSDFVEIAEAGGMVRSVPSYRTTGAGDDYSPRNTAGTLLHASMIGYSRSDLIVLCDPDMIFVRKPSFPRRLSAEYYSYLNYDQKDVRAAARRLEIRAELFDQRKGEVLCGVPHVIPVACARSLAEAWLEAIDAFTPGLWEISMYAFGLAVIKLGLKLELTNLVATNYTHDSQLGRANVVHYCYGNDRWSKRKYFSSRLSKKVWDAPVRASGGTVLSEIVSQIREARSFYSNKNGHSPKD